MWSEAAKWLAKYPDAVITGLDADGAPYSIRQDGSRYDGRTGEFPIDLPEVLRPTSGPANLLCHKHDERLWNLSSISIAGRLDRREDDWVFVSTAFTPPSRLALWKLSKRMRKAARRYLTKRHLEMPKVNWPAVTEIWQDARTRQPEQ